MSKASEHRDSALWITGVGMVTPLGTDVPTTMRRLFAGERAIGELSLFSLPGARSKLAAEVRGLDWDQEHARADTMALRAAAEALTCAGFSPAEAPCDMVVGGTTAGMFETEHLLTEIGSAEVAGSSAQIDLRLRTHPLSSTADRLHERLGPFGVTRTICCACTSGAAALALAAAWIRTGRSERVLAGGVDALCRLTVSGFGSLAVLDPNPCRPFDRTRAGLNLGEGAGFLLIERADLALARGARPIVELAGWALGGEAHHITNPEPSGRTARRVLSRAIEVSGITPTEIGYVNAHGTATPLNDAAEASALRACFAEHRVPVSSSKGQIGHTLGAAGAIEAVICARAIVEQRLPPTRGLTQPDPACPVDHVLESIEVDHPFAALSSSFGFGGTAGAVVLKPVGSELRGPIPAASLVVTAVAVVADGCLLASPSELVALLSDDACVQSAVPPPDPTQVLDAGRTRRMDRSARLTTLVFGAALDQSDQARAPLSRETVATISATACGNVDGCMRFVKRVLEKGAQFAMPAEFPNLVPSSPVSHASIYWKLGGPALAAPDLSATAESSIATGLELVAGEVSEAALCGSVEEVSLLSDRVLAPLLGDRQMAAKVEGASAILVERESGALARGRAPLARVNFWQARRGALDLTQLPAPAAGAKVIAEPAVKLEDHLADSPWARVPRLTTSRLAGEHLGLGGVAFAAAAALIAEGGATSALVIGDAPGRVYVFHLEAAEVLP